MLAIIRVILFRLSTIDLISLLNPAFTVGVTNRYPNRKPNRRFLIACLLSNRHGTSQSLLGQMSFLILAAGHPYLYKIHTLSTDLLISSDQLKTLCCRRSSSTRRSFFKLTTGSCTYVGRYVTNTLISILYYLTSSPPLRRGFTLKRIRTWVLVIPCRRLRQVTKLLKSRTAKNHRKSRDFQRKPWLLNPLPMRKREL